MEPGGSAQVVPLPPGRSRSTAARGCSSRRPQPRRARRSGPTARLRWRRAAARTRNRSRCCRGRPSTRPRFPTVIGDDAGELLRVRLGAHRNPGHGPQQRSRAVDALRADVDPRGATGPMILPRDVDATRAIRSDRGAPLIVHPLPRGCRWVPSTARPSGTGAARTRREIRRADPTTQCTRRPRYPVSRTGDSWAPVAAHTAIPFAAHTGAPAALACAAA